MEADTDTEATDTDTQATDTRAESALRRSDRWSSEPAGAHRNWWVPVGAVLVLAGYGLAALVVRAALGEMELSDEAGKVLVAAAPAAAALGTALAFVGTRRTTLRVLAWIVLAVGLVLVLASIAAVAWVLLALRDFS